jgi:hypothetical protein
MNERIRELAADAGYPDYMTYGQDKVLERFAELIVKECAAVQHKRFCEHGDVSWDILMQHFGIKE